MLLFKIVGGLGTSISLDEATHNRVYGHYTCVLVDVDLTGKLHGEILVKHDDFTFLFVGIEYDKLPSFCSRCQSIGHSLSICKKQAGKENVMLHNNPPVVKKDQLKCAHIFVPKNNEVNLTDHVEKKVTLSGKKINNIAIQYTLVVLESEGNKEIGKNHITVNGEKVDSISSESVDIIYDESVQPVEDHLIMFQILLFNNHLLVFVLI